MSRLMLLYTARPEFHSPWPVREHHAQLTLNRLSRRDVRTIIGGIDRGATLVDEVVDALVERSGGVPLFAEELAHSAIESGIDSAAHQIPATLQDSLMARLDRLGAAKEVAHVAAVIGRDLSYPMLHAVAPIPDEAFQSQLSHLAHAELNYTRAKP